MRKIPVSSVVSRINAFLREKVKLGDAWISGELSNVRYVSGHCYFDLKDENGQLSCTLWRTNASRAGFRLEDGMAVLVRGMVGVYEKRGTLQLNVDEIQLDGTGALFLELQKRKERLMREGLFAPERKKPRPLEINSIAIVTGESTAALKDALRTIRDRWPMLDVTLFPAPVQGVDAPPKIIEALKEADQAGKDAVLLIRGGGSFEDLFCFNDEGIVRQLAAMKTYTVTGIGHEIDNSLADYAADHRALTPTAAAQWVTLDRHEVQNQLTLLKRQLLDRARRHFDQAQSQLLYTVASSPLSNPAGFAISRQDRLRYLESRLQAGYESLNGYLEHRLERYGDALIVGAQNGLNAKAADLSALYGQLLYHSPEGALREASLKLRSLSASLRTQMAGSLEQKQKALEHMGGLLDALSYTRTLERGFSIVLQNGHPIKAAGSLKIDEPLQIRFAQGSAVASVLSTNETDTDRHSE